MLYPVRPVVLEVDPGPSGPVNDRIPDFRSSGGFSGGKKKSKKIGGIFFYFSVFLDTFIFGIFLFSIPY